FDFNENILDTIFIKENYDTILHIHVYKDAIWILTNSMAYRVNQVRKITDTIYYNRLFSPTKKNYNAVFFMPDKFWGKCLSTTNEGTFMNYGGASSFHPLNDLLNDYSYLSPSGDSGAYWRDDRQNKLVEIVDGTIIKKQFQLDKSLIVNKIIPFSKEKSILIASTTIKWLYPNGTSTGFLNTDTFIYNKNIFTSDYNHFYSAVSDVLVIDSTNFIFLASGFAGASHVTTYPGRQKIHAIAFDTERYEDVLYYPAGGFCILYNSRKVLLYDAFNRTKVAISTDILKALKIQSIEKIDVDKYGNLIIKTYDRLILFNPITCKIRRLFPNYNFHNSFINLSGDTLSMAGNFGVAWCKTTSTGNINSIRTYPNTKALFYKYIYNVQFSRSSILLKTDKGAYIVSVNGTSNITLDKYKLVVNKEGTLININAKDTFIVNPTTEVLGVDVIKPTGTGNLNITYSINGGSFNNTGYQLILPSLKPGSYNTVSVIASDDSWRSKPIKFTIY
ncbi:MAG: hypothetical protein H3C64_15600, partial [Candidatus Kuenenia stuttgartiensis]|nr:hypothetical protein [Candidatus Kuenenia stuttgartiensis]